MVTLDNRFERPEDVDGIDGTVEVITQEDPVDDSEVEDVSGQSVLIRPPDTFKIVSVTTRFAADGTSVVDIVAEIEDVPGAQGYETRITKIG